MITKQNCMGMILRLVPAFQEHWQAHLLFWNGEEAGLCNDMAEFSHYVMDIIKGEQPANLPVIFDLIEQLIVNGDSEVRDAAATCFLENLSNAATAGELDARDFVNFLGPESRAYCKAWDEFTGVHTEGL